MIAVFNLIASVTFIERLLPSVPFSGSPDRHGRRRDAAERGGDEVSSFTWGLDYNFTNYDFKTTSSFIPLATYFLFCKSKCLFFRTYNW